MYIIKARTKRLDTQGEIEVATLKEVARLLMMNLASKQMIIGIIKTIKVFGRCRHEWNHSYIEVTKVMPRVEPEPNPNLTLTEVLELADKNEQ